MTFQQMQYVLEVYQAGSVSGAAKKLFVSQSSVSLSISSLEKELGYPVFIRVKKRRRSHTPGAGSHQSGSTDL